MSKGYLRSFWEKFVWNNSTASEQRGDTFTFQNVTQFRDWFIDTFDKSSGQNVSVESGSKLATVFSCLNVLGQDVASLPLQLKQKTDNGNVSLNSPLQRLINKKPNRYENAWQFWYSMVFVGEGHGNSYAYITRDGSMNPISMIRLKPWCVDPQIIDGECYYIVTNGTERVAIPSRDILHYRSFVYDDPILGYSKILWNARLMGLKMKQADYSSNSIENRPPGILFMDSATEIQQKQIRDAWGSDLKAGRTPFLWGPGLKYQQLMLTPEAAEIVESNKWSDQQTYGVWRMQPALLSNHDKSTYSNTEQQNIAHVMYTLLPILTNLEQEIDEKLISERAKSGQNPVYSKFNVKGLLRGDTQAQTEFIRTMRTLGIYNADRILDLLDEPRIGGDVGEKYAIQGAMVDVESLKKDGQNGQTSARMMNDIEDLINKYKVNGHKLQ